MAGVWKLIANVDVVGGVEEGGAAESWLAGVRCGKPAVIATHRGSYLQRYIRDLLCNCISRYRTARGTNLVSLESSH